MATKKNGSNTEHIDQIREIILGPQKKDYEERFEKVEADLEQLRAEMKAGIEKTRDALTAEIRETARRLEQAVHDASSAQEKENSRLRARADELGHQASSQLEGFISESGKRMTALHGEINQTLGLLQNELDNRLRTISDGTVSRLTLGEMLAELAMRFKNEQPDDALQKTSGMDRESSLRD